MSIELPDLVQVVRVNTAAMRAAQRDMDVFGRSFQEVQQQAAEPVTLKTDVDDDDSKAKVAGLKRELADLEGEARVGADTTEAKAEVAAVRAELARLEAVDHVEVEVDVEAETARQNVRRLNREIAAVQRRIDVDAEVDPSAYAEIAQLRARLATLDTTAHVNVETDTAAANVHNLARAFWDLKTATSIIPAVTRGLMVPGAVTAVTLLTSAVSALAAGAVAVTGALAPATGAVVSFGQAGVALISTIKTVSFLTKEVGKAAGVMATAKEGSEEYREALEALPRSARGFAKDLAGLRREIADVRKEGQRAAFPGFRDAIAESGPLLAAFEAGVVGVSGALGDLAHQAVAAYSTPLFQGNLATVIGTNTELVGELGAATIDLGRSMTTLGAAAAPLTLWLADLAHAGSENAASFLEQAQASGALGDFFANTSVVLESLGRTMRDFGAAMGDVFGIGATLGAEFLAAMEAGAARFRDFTESARGQNSITQFFADARPVLVETGRLIHDIFAMFGQLATSTDLAPVIGQIRTQLLPALGELLGGTTRFGSSFVTMATAVVKAINLLSFSPLIKAVEIVADLVIGFTDLVHMVPGLSTLAATLITVGLSLKAIQTIGRLTGVLSLIDVLGGITPAGNKAVGALGSVALGIKGVERPAQGANTAAMGLGAGLASLAGALHMSVGRLAAWGAGAGVMVAALHTLKSALEPAAPDVDKLTGSLLDFQQNGVLAGEAARVLGGDFKGLADAVSQISGMSGWGHEWAGRTSLGLMDAGLDSSKKKVDGLDKALAGLVSAGYGDLAKQIFQDVAAGVEGAGGNVDDLTSQLNDYNAATLQADNATKAGKASADGYASAQERVAAASRSAATAIEAEKRAIDELNGVQQTAYQAAINLDRAKRAAKETADGARGANLDERQSLATLAQAWKDEAAAKDHGRRGTERWMATLRDGNRNLRQAAINMGLSKTEAAALADELIKVPTVKDIAIRTPGWKEANQTAEDTDYLLDRLDKKKVTPEVRAKIEDLERKERKARQDLNRLGKMKPTPKVLADIESAQADLEVIQDQVEDLDGQVAVVGLNFHAYFTGDAAAISRAQQGLGLETGVTAPNRPRRAGGGPVAGGTAYIVGEEGPELFVPKSSGNVVPADQTAAILAGSGKASAAAAENAGRAIGEGFAKGVAGSAATVLAAMQQMAAQAYGTFTDYFGIASPSTLMEMVGADLILGLVQGITGTALGQLQSGAQQVREQLFAAFEAHAEERGGLAEQLEDENTALAKVLAARDEYLADYQRQVDETRRQRRQEDADRRRERRRFAEDQEDLKPKDRETRKERRRREADEDREDRRRRAERKRENEARAREHAKQMADFLVQATDARDMIATTEGLIRDLDEMGAAFTSPQARDQLAAYVDQQTAQLARLEAELGEVTRQYEEADAEWKRLIAERDAFAKQVAASAVSFASALNAFNTALQAAQTRAGETARELVASAQERVTAATAAASAAQNLLNQDVEAGITTLDRLASRQAAVEETTLALAAANAELAAAQEAETTAAQNASVTGDEIVASLQARLDALRAFATNIAALQAAGLNQSSLRQIVEAGVEGGGAAAAALAASGANVIATLNAQQAEIEKVAGDLGMSTASAFYDAGIDAAAGIVAGLQARMGEITAQMTQIGTAIANAIKAALGIASPSKVMAGVGDDIIAGLLGSLETSLGDVQEGGVAVGRSAVDGLLRAVSGSLGGIGDLGSKLAGSLSGGALADTVSGTPVPRLTLRATPAPAATTPAGATTVGGAVFYGPVNVFDPEELAQLITKKQRRAALVARPV